MIKPWYLYILECNDHSLYTGITTDVERRLEEHSQQTGKGAKYLRGKSPFVLRYQAIVGGHGEALKLERAIKKLSKKDKIDWIKAQTNQYFSTPPAPKGDT